MVCQQDLGINEDETTSPYLTSTSGRTKAVKNVQHSSLLKLSFSLRCWCCKMELMVLSWYFIFHCRDHRVKTKPNQKNLRTSFFPADDSKLPWVYYHHLWIFLHNDRYICGLFVVFFRSVWSFILKKRGEERKKFFLHTPLDILSLKLLEGFI